MLLKRDTLADMFSLITFSFFTGMAIELLIAGLSFAQSLQSRLLSIPVNMILGRPYGLYRNWIMKKGRAHKGGTVRLALLDMLAYVTFQIPAYSMLVISTGASAEQVLSACIGQVGSFILLARPYGLYMQGFRTLFSEKTIVQQAI
ncbi:L-alanine exporter AlaE [invertebrate metagenome]|uniref:L-alanine exporter AlaE n=1 Tax=invertebrate metagenome TaxID=1711999 RepID=A0A2H9TAS0_9ZZZZ